MRLKKLIQQIPEMQIKGSTEIEITGITSNSRLVAPGHLFIAKKGKTHDGGKFIPEALAAGASCVLTDLYDPFLPVTQLIYPQIEKIEGKLAACFYGYPSSQLKMIGVTGTSGKTTSTFLIKHLFDQRGIKAGLIGTIEWIIGEHRFPSTMTTPDVITNHKLLKEMVGTGCQVAVMEVSSHGLDQNRVDEIDFSIALFTNLTPEHLDYHGNMEAYKEAKGKLFAHLKEGSWAVLNGDSPYTFETKAKVFTFGMKNQADLMAKEIVFTEKGAHFILSYRGGEIPCYSPLIGHFNVYNVLGAIAVALCSGISLEECAQAIKSFKGIPGRLQKVKTPFGAHVFVDFAHKEEALEKTLEALNAIKKKRVITVFGCGGDRDRQKRKKMGATAEKYSDLTIVTSDNPRSEDPTQIASEILEGFSGSRLWVVELDRKKAIEKALDFAEKEDIILIAGKGHEKEQIFAHHVIPFDDVAVVEKYCREKVCR